MTGFLQTLFSWPNGIVVGNLIASLIWAVPTVLHLDRLARKHHKEHMAMLHRYRTVTPTDEKPGRLVVDEPNQEAPNA